MGIAALFFSAFLFRKRIKDENNKNKLMICGAVAVYFVFSLILNWYLREVYGWTYGIPGSDLQRYYSGAEALKSGVNLSELVSIDAAYELSFTHLGYIAYVVLIAATALTPVIISVEFSLQLLYSIQSFVAITAALNIADFFAKNEESGKLENLKNRNTILWAILLCTSVMQMSALLMRDIWILFFISCLLIECKKREGSIIKCIILIMVCAAARYYTLVITIPIFLGYRINKKKAAAISSLVVFGTFLVGQGYIDYLARFVGINWSYHYSFDLYSLGSYILFPNPVNQAYNVQHMNTSFHAIFGGNTEWIYYLLSCWNVFVFPVATYGIYRSIRDGEGEDAAIWGMIIVNIAMMMCLFYNAVSSPRHKLLIVISIAYFFKKGIEAMRPRLKLAYCYIVVLGLLVIFAAM